MGPHALQTKKLKPCRRSKVARKLWRSRCCRAGVAQQVWSAGLSLQVWSAVVAEQVWPSMCGPARVAQQVLPSRFRPAGFAQQVWPSKCGLFTYRVRGCFKLGFPNECPNQEYCLQTFPWICCDSIVPAIAQSTWNQVGDLKPRSDSLWSATVATV